MIIILILGILIQYDYYTNIGHSHQYDYYFNIGHSHPI